MDEEPIIIREDDMRRHCDIQRMLRSVVNRYEHASAPKGTAKIPLNEVPSNDLIDSAVERMSRGGEPTAKEQEAFSRRINQMTGRQKTEV